MAEFVEVMNEFDRMCNSYEDNCDECTMHEARGIYKCNYYIFKDPKEAEEVIMKWAKEHPIKTNADKFKEVFGVDIDKDECGCTGLKVKCEQFTDCEDCEYRNFWVKEYKEPGKEMK